MRTVSLQRATRSYSVIPLTHCLPSLSVLSLHRRSTFYLRPSALWFCRDESWIKLLRWYGIIQPVDIKLHSEMGALLATCTWYSFCYFTCVTMEYGSSISVSVRACDNLKHNEALLFFILLYNSYFTELEHTHNASSL